jgi:trehalose 6-phosphate phosphatase
VATLMEWAAKDAENEDALLSPQAKLDDFFQSVAAAKKSALLLDFDGTLAPFRIDPAKVRPWAGVVSLLEAIQQTNRTRIAIVTGRPAANVASQLHMKKTPEIWGLHGAERLYPDGRIEEEELTSSEQEALDNARSCVRAAADLGARIEEKRNAIVLHWRGISSHSAHGIRRDARDLLSPSAGVAGMRLLQFDGGIELRAGRHKGDAVRIILNEIPDNAPIAYLGDDTTDEDAFEALAGGRGLSVLVRRQWRHGAAQAWLRPPVQLREFLAAWLHATQI